jgi:putative adenylate-forming enzyme
MSEKLLILFYFMKFRWFSRFKGAAALQRLQRNLYQKQLAFIRRNSAFYKENKGLPIIDKGIFMERFDSINTVGINKEKAMNFAIECEKTRDFGKKLGGVTVGLSSGTSGHRGAFLISDRERAIWAGAILARTLPKNHLFGVKIAFFMRANSELYETVRSRMIQFEFFDMLGDMGENFQKLLSFRPTMLVAPPSCLLVLAKWNAARVIKPKKVISIAEVLEEADAEIIKEAFDVTAVHQIYQCTEGFLGVTCEHGVLHINEDIVKIEKEKLGNRRFVPIVTDLRRRAQPVVRYRLNDILIERREPCPCGSPFLALEKIEGRQDDVFEFDGENGAPVAVFPDFIRRCVLFADGVGEYRVQQISHAEIAVLADELSDDTKMQILQEFKKLAAHYRFCVPNILFKPYEYEGTRKLKRIEKLC